ncbi:MAG: 5-(carboxyamino)imidazole ribonucleotide synthase [bacterium]
MSDKRVILPGATIGVLGSGQLGRIFTLAAREMGYRVETFSPDSDTPTGQVADREVQASYDDLDAVRAFAASVDLITFEFENVPAATAAACAEQVPVRPNGTALHIAQHRLREKTWLEQHHFPVPAFQAIANEADLRRAAVSIWTPAILKTAGFGYDGKGQVRITTPADLPAAWESMGRVEAVLETQVNFQCELSVIGARGLDGDYADFGVFENRHVSGVLDITRTPASIDRAHVEEARDMAHAIIEELDVVGILCVEMFLTTSGKLLVNELAPRAHNSGHLTTDACRTSQFAQQLRAICGLPLGDTTYHAPAAMANLLGDRWEGGEPDWAAALEDPAVSLHLYGKSDARPGRKMGHLTALGLTVEDAEKRVVGARERLTAIR